MNVEKINSTRTGCVARHDAAGIVEHVDHARRRVADVAHDALARTDVALPRGLEGVDEARAADDHARGPVLTVGAVCVADGAAVCAHGLGHGHALLLAEDDLGGLGVGVVVDDRGGIVVVDGNDRRNDDGVGNGVRDSGRWRRGRERSGGGGGVLGDGGDVPRHGVCCRGRRVLLQPLEAPGLWVPLHGPSVGCSVFHFGINVYADKAWVYVRFLMSGPGPSASLVKVVDEPGPWVSDGADDALALGDDALGEPAHHEGDKRAGGCETRWPRGVVGRSHAQDVGHVLSGIRWSDKFRGVPNNGWRLECVR